MTQLSDYLNSLNRDDWSSRRIEDEAAKLGHRLNFTTAARYLKGNHPAKPSDAVLAAFAAVFRSDLNDLRAVAGRPPAAGRFELPAEADTLDPDERQAIVNLVRVMARNKTLGTPTGDSMSVPDDLMVDYELTRGQSTEGGLDAVNRQREERQRDARPR